jgi:hypothetical protein
MASKYTNGLERTNRFSDSEEEHLHKLPPIRGYKEMPLVPLEEAVVPLIPLVPEVERMVWTVKDDKHSPEDGLTMDESASIMLYSMEWTPRENSFFFILNVTLRAADRVGLRPWFLFLKLIITALSRLPSIHKTVYRGVKLDLRAKYPLRSTCVWWGFNSCTSTIKGLENEQFFGKSGTRTLFSIECNSGKDIQRHSLYPTEGEILLLPGRYLVVTSCLEAGNDLYIIGLKEIEPPFPLLESLSINKLSCSVPNMATNMGVLFVDVSNPAGLKRVSWSTSAPDWRRAVHGICFEGTCTTATCVAYSKQVVIRIGMGKFDLLPDANATTCQCPKCHQYVEPMTCAFNNCYWRWSGIKQVSGKPPETCSSGDSWIHADNAYHYFDDAISGQVTWRKLLLEAKKHE